MRPDQALTHWTHRTRAAGNVVKKAHVMEALWWKYVVGRTKCKTGASQPEAVQGCAVRKEQRTVSDSQYPN